MADPETSLGDGIPFQNFGESMAFSDWQSAESQLDNFEKTSQTPPAPTPGPTPQNQTGNIMASSPYLLAMIALGGKVMGANGQTMLGATNGMMQGILKGSQQQYEDAWKEYDSSYQKAMQHWQAQQTAYNQGLQMYKGRVDQKYKALEFARQATADQRAVDNQSFEHHMALDKYMLDLQNTKKQQDFERERIGIELQKLDLARQKMEGGGNGGMGARQEVYFSRIVAAGNEAAQAAENIMELPITVDKGILGSGHQVSIMDASKSALANEVSSQEVQDYRVMISGVKRNLAAIEASGLAPSGSLTEAMGGVEIQAGDSQITKLRKMAELRQIVEKGLEPNLSNPKIPPQQKQVVQGIMDQMKRAIPFTQHDVTALQQAKNPQLTINDIAKSKGLAPGSANPQTQQSSQAGQQITATGPNGRKVVLKDGQWVPLGQ